jgi:glutamyl/glutaminyl-tRNA synthetase
MNSTLGIDIKKWNIGKDLQKELKTHKGKIITRFPPEPSGFFHIGHAKALFINYIVSKYNDFGTENNDSEQTTEKNSQNGQMLIRIDDTNPSKESSVYTREIINDIESLIGGDFKEHITYTSDYFNVLIDCAEYLLMHGLAYVDETSVDQVKQERLEKKDSKYRDTLIYENILKWNQMKEGTLTHAILRLKIKMNHLNGCMRDPTIYRCMEGDIHHERTGNSYKVYPTYDFACPIVDVQEKVTHVFRSTEFTDRDEQYKWIITALGLTCPKLYGYGKLVFKDAVLSKRKIRALIDQGVVDNWNSPKLLTLQGIRRRGLSNKGLLLFLDTIGITRTSVEMTQDLLWKGNLKIIDKIATRYQALQSIKLSTVKIVDFDTNNSDDQRVVVGDIGVNQTTKITKIPRFNRCKELGMRDVIHSRDLYIDHFEVDLNNKFEIDEEITFINWGNAICVDNTIGSIKFKLNLQGDFKITKKKISWISAQAFTLLSIVQYSYDITDSPVVTRYYGEYDMRNLKKGDYVQLMRMNYYICDREYDGGDVVLIELPLSGGDKK